MSPAHIDDLESYVSWVADQINKCGGWLEEDRLIYELVPFVSRDDEPSIALLIPKHTVRFGDDSFLVFDLVVSEEMVEEDYRFHFQGPNGQIWRKDRHRGHPPDRSRIESHIHDDPKDPDGYREYKDVDIAEVIAEIHDYFESGRMPGD